MKQSLYSLIFLLSITTVLSAADSNIVPASTGIYIIGPATISQPGSYIVAQDIMGTITITADNVFLDLNEKTLFAPAGGNGIEVVDQENIEIRNGIIDGLANTSLHGVFLENCTTVLLENVIIQGHGIGSVGAAIALPNCSFVTIKSCIIKENIIGIIVELPDQANNTVITGCTVQENLFTGILVDDSRLTIANCIVVDNGALGIRSSSGIISNCTVASNQDGGIRGSSFLNIRNCIITQNGGTGCDMISNSSIQDSEITANGDSGIVMFGPSCIARANIITNNTTDGVRCLAAANLVGGNTILNNGLSGIRNNGSDNSFFNNKAQQNGPTQTENYTGVPASTIAIFQLSTGTFISTPTICCDVNLSIVP